MADSLEDMMADAISGQAITTGTGISTLLASLGPIASALASALQGAACIAKQTDEPKAAEISQLMLCQSAVALRISRCAKSMSEVEQAREAIVRELKGMDE